MAVTTTTNYGYKKPDYTEDGDILLINDNMDDIDEDLHDLSTGKKSTQAAVNNPSTSGTELAFIDTISQNAQGVITPTRKTVKDMVGAGSSNGAHGLVPQPNAADKDKFLKGDGTWATPANTTYSAGTGLSLSGTTFNMANSGATAGSYGMSAATTGNNGTTVNIPYITVDATGRVTAISNKVLTCVNTDTNTTYSAASGGGLSLSGTAFSLANSGATAGSYGMSANTTGSNGTTVSIPYITVDAKGRVTAISNKTLTCVNTDTNTTYSAASNGGLSLSGTAFSLASSIPGARTFSDTTESTTTATGAVKISGGLGVAKNIVGNKVYNAVWNDYAECRESNETQPGRVVRETIMGVMVKTEKRRMRGCKIISDTYGTCMGETDKAKTPIGVAGRVLAYPARDKSKFYLGAPVCSGPNGTVDVMSRLEAILFPECIIGTVSEIPRYETWKAGTKKNPTEINVDGRIWIYVR